MLTPDFGQRSTPDCPGKANQWGVSASGTIATSVSCAGLAGKLQSRIASTIAFDNFAFSSGDNSDVGNASRDHVPRCFGRQAAIAGLSCRLLPSPADFSG